MPITTDSELTEEEPLETTRHPSYGADDGVIAAVVRPWSEALPSVALRLAHDEARHQVEVRIGRLDASPFRLRLVAARQWGEVHGSQFVERYADGQVRTTSPWEDGWTVREECAEWTYRRWVEHWLLRLIARYLDWGPQSIREGKLTLLDWATALDELRRAGEDRIAVNQVTARFMRLASVYVEAVEGTPRGVTALVEGVRASEGGLDDGDSVASLVLAHGSQQLPSEVLPTFLEGLGAWLPQALTQAIDRVREDRRRFEALKRLAEEAPHAIGQVVVAHLDAALARSEPGRADERALRDQIVRYNKLFRGWQTYSPSCANPLEEGMDFLSLEARINRAWRAQVEACDGLARSELEGRLVRDGRFLSGATGSVLGWMRIERRYEEAMTIFAAQAKELELFVLRARSQPHAFENMVFCAMGSYLDCGTDAHLPEAVELLKTLEARYEWATGRADYQLACVFARAGDSERALQAVERCARQGAIKARMAHDTDLESIWEAPRFKAALATGR